MSIWGTVSLWEDDKKESRKIWFRLIKNNDEEYNPAINITTISISMFKLLPMAECSSYLW